VRTNEEVLKIAHPYGLTMADVRHESLEVHPGGGVVLFQESIFCVAHQKTRLAHSAAMIRWSVSKGRANAHGTLAHAHMSHRSPVIRIFTVQL